MPNGDYQALPLPFDKEVIGVSKKALEIHHDKLYAGYVAKMNEIEKKLAAMRDDADSLEAANATYSGLRGLRNGETFATNAAYLHEYHFVCLGGSGKPEGALPEAIAAKWGSLEKFIAMFSASGMAMRGWVVLAYDTRVDELKIYGCDSHDQGAVWGSIPLVVLDVYEHAYFMDYGADRKRYIADFWKNMDWRTASENYLRCLKLTS
jgi:superoxide dismutase, Fe-Mn family